MLIQRRRQRIAQRVTAHIEFIAAPDQLLPHAAGARMRLMENNKNAAREAACHNVNPVCPLELNLGVRRPRVQGRGGHTGAIISLAA